MATKQTAVDWILTKIARDKLFYEFFKVDIQQAKAMEKEQIKDAYKAGCVDEMWELKDTENEEHYYNKTYVTNAE